MLTSEERADIKREMLAAVKDARSMRTVSRESAASSASMAAALGMLLLVEDAESSAVTLEVISNRLNRAEMSLDNIAANTLGRR